MFTVDCIHVRGRYMSRETIKMQCKPLSTHILFHRGAFDIIIHGVKYGMKPRVRRYRMPFHRFSMLLLSDVVMVGYCYFHCRRRRRHHHRWVSF